MDFNLYLHFSKKAVILLLSFVCTLSISAQIFQNKVEVERGVDDYCFASVSIDDQVYLNVYEMNNSVINSSFFRVNATGIKDSAPARDFNDSIVYFFRFAYEKDQEIYWIGVYYEIANWYDGHKGGAVVKTDTNFNILDRVLIEHEGEEVNNYTRNDNRIFLTISTFPGFNAPLHLIEVNISVSPFTIEKDTSYSVVSGWPSSLVISDTLLRVVHYHSILFNTIGLGDYSISDDDTLAPSNYHRYNVGVMNTYQDTLLISSNDLSHRLMLHDLNMNLLDTLNIESEIAGAEHYSLPGSELVIGSNYYYGGIIVNTIDDLTDITLTTYLRILKITDFTFDWEIIIHDDSTHKFLTNIIESNSPEWIYLVYIEYDHRKGNMQRNVVVTMMDTSGNVLSKNIVQHTPIASVSVYPNPVDVSFVFNGIPGDDYTLTIIDVSGKVYKDNLHVSSREEVYVQDLPSGHYLIRAMPHRGDCAPAILKMIKM